MLRKRLLLIVLIVILIFSASGCMLFWDIALRFNQSVKSETALPTLPNNNAELIPLDVFTSYVEYTAPSLSPDGSSILYRHMTGFQDDVIVEDWKTGSQKIVVWPEAQGNPGFMWAPDGKTILFFIDDNGDENYGFYTSDIDTGETKTLLIAGENNCYPVSVDSSDESLIYIALFNFQTNLFDLYLFNYYTGKKTLALKNPGQVKDYTFDDKGNLRAVTMTDDKAGKHIWTKNDINDRNTSFSDKGWTKVKSWDYSDAGSSGILGIMPDGENILYIDSSESNTSALYQKNIKTGAETKIFSDPDYDIYNAWTDLSLDKVTAVTVYSQKLEWEILDPSFQDDYDALKSIGDDFDIVDSSDGDKYWIVDYRSDVKKDDYYVYDMAANQETHLFNAQPDIEEYEFASSEPFSFSASDGLKLEGYATAPNGTEKKNLPTVLLVHGGPWDRDYWEFNEEVQFLANRGYLVLQVNFRGSTGYGRNFMLAGDKEWGAKMHQDILDAVNFAILSGWTDPDRVGVYGASYGGYEALCCAAFSSEVFKCAVDAFGPSDLITFIQSIPAQWSVDRQSLIRSIGDPVTDEALLKERSPLYYADDIKIPMLIAQGENDARVPVQQSDQMVDALKKAGVIVTYLRYPDTGHGFNTNEEREEFYSSMENFFAQYLGAQAD